MKKSQNGSCVPDSGLHARLLLAQFHDVHLDVHALRHEVGLGREKVTEVEIVLAGV